MENPSIFGASVGISCWGSSPDSSSLHKHISLAQLLELADPPLKLQDVAKTGASAPVMEHGEPYCHSCRQMMRKKNTWFSKNPRAWLGAWWRDFPHFWRNPCNSLNLGSSCIVFWCGVVVKMVVTEWTKDLKEQNQTILQIFCCHVWRPAWLFLRRN